uniref:Secreted protein n=1 Tax=Panagrellus redivivus TaxID=6233 RepID=A0A7E4VHN7_PANRE
MHFCPVVDRYANASRATTTMHACIAAKTETVMMEASEAHSQSRAETSRATTSESTKKGFVVVGLASSRARERLRQCTRLPVHLVGNNTTGRWNGMGSMNNAFVVRGRSDRRGDKVEPNIG